MAKRKSPSNNSNMESSSSSSRRRNSNTQSNSSSRQQPNLNSSNHYEILGVPKNATTQQIKVSYRKLALQFHPDRLPPDATSEDKQAAHKSFTKIGHAYEILSDETRRQEYDAEQQQGSQSSRRGRDPFSMNGDSFFSSFGMRNSRRRSAFDEFHFMDPFELFNQFFSDEMDSNGNGRSQSRSSRNSSRGSRSRSAFDNDPFFGSDPFFSPGFGRSSMMSSHFGMMNSMMSQMDSQSLMNNGSASFFTSSTSSSGRGGGQSVSTSTRTTIVNGVRQTVTERTVVHPDGRVERHVETSGNENHEALPAPSSRPAIGYDDRRSRRR